MDRRRLVDVRAGNATGVQASGTGYLIGPHLVLTARHIVVDDSGCAWKRVETWIGHPADGRVTHCVARVLWKDLNSDIALLRLESEAGLPNTPIRWGCFIGSSPVQYEGLAFPTFSRYESGPGLEQLGGQLPPLAIGDNSCYVLDQSTGPVPDGTRQWGGASGAPIFCGDLLVGMVVKDDREFGNTRLHATRLIDVVSSPDFANLVVEDTGNWPTAEAVELIGFLKSPQRRLEARTPGSLLAADLEAVAFTGRREILEDLSRWRDSKAQLGVVLVAGEGGQGKTRLAQEFVRLSAKSGWVAGFIETVSAHGRPSRRAPDPGLIKLLRASNRPILIVADYAEIHSEYVENIVDLIREEVARSPVRLLLLSRSVNAWWENISEMLPGEDVRLITLAPLTSAATDRRAVYAAGVIGLARHLPKLNIGSAGNPAAVNWPVVATGLAANPPDLSDDRLGNALTLLMTALTDLLAVGSGEAPLRVEKSEEQELVAHELGYLRRTATKRGLFDKNVLSRRADLHDRNSEAWAILEKAIAGLILLGPTNADRAHIIGALASQDRAEDIGAWLASLYPAAGEYSVIGSMQPDRLAELVLGRLLSKRQTLAGEIARRVDNFDGAIALLFSLLRTGAYPQFASIRGQAREIITKQPIPFAEAALVLTVNLAHVASVQGSVLAGPALQAILQNAYFISDPVNPEEFAGAMRMALERLALPSSTSAGPEISVPDASVEPVIAADRFDHPDNLYQELSRGGPVFVQALLDVAIDVMDVRRDWKSEQFAPVEQPAPNYKQLVEEVYSSNYHQLVRLAILFVHDREAAEDMVQSSFEEILGVSSKARDAQEILINSRRVIINRARSPLRMTQDHARDLTPVHIGGDAPGIEDYVVDRSDIAAAMRLLPRRQSEVIALRYYGDYAEVEIAEVLGISRGSVKSQLARGLVALREIMRTTS